MEGNVRRSLGVLGLSFFIANVEYTVVMPSIWHYLKSRDEDHYWFLGLTLASFNITQMLSGFIISFIINRRPMREGLWICFLFGIIGNTMYGFAENGWMILGGRALCGVSGNIGIVQSTYVGKVVPEQDRSSVFAILNAVAGVGMLVGPALNFGLGEIDFVVAGFHVNPYNVPGFFLVACQLILCFIILLLFNEPSASEYYRSQQETTLIESKKHESEIFPSSNSNRWFSENKQLFTPALIALYVAEFLSLFNQTTLETIITPVAKEYFHWKTLQNSFFFASITLIFLLMFFIIHILSSRYGWTDRGLILIGHFWQGCGFFIFLGIIIADKITGDTIVLWKFILPCTFIVIGLPFGWVCIGSLISKHVPESLQSSVSGVNNFVLSLACILGPLWSGFSLGINLLVLVSLIIFLWLCSSALLAWNWSKLMPQSLGKMETIKIDSSSSTLSLTQHPNEKTALVTINN